MQTTFKRHPRAKAVKIITLLLLAASIICGSIIIVRFTHQPVISPLPDKFQISNHPIVNLSKAEKDPTELRKIVQDTIGNQWPNYSVYVMDLKSDFTMGLNEAQIFTAASINKIPILAGLYYYVQKGTVNLDKTISIQFNDIQDYGTGSIRYDPPGTTYSIKTLARLMMQKSDNTASYILANYTVGASKIQSLLDEWGLNQTNIEQNKTSNKDIATLMRKIIDGNIANAALTEEMLTFMKDSDFEDRLPRNLPPGTPVFHKIGTGVGAVHDVGVIIGPSTTYYIGIFTENVSDEEQAAELISEVSKKVYDFML